MSPALNLDTVPTDVFVQIIDVPAAGPWDQHRAAQMSAELAAPLPAGQSVLCLRRLGRWSPGRPGRFAIGYMRASDQPGDRIRTVAVEDQPVRFVFQDPGVRAARHRAWLINAGLATGMTFCLLVAAWTWGQRHDRAVEALQIRARQANLDLREYRLRALQARNLTRMQPELLGRSGGKVASDLAWLDAARDRRARLSAVVWTRDALQVSTTSNQPPIATAEPVTVIHGAGGQWRVIPPTSRVDSARPSVVSRAPLRRPTS